jgi:hypothetical protein
MGDGKKNLAIAYGVKKRMKMAKGGVAAQCPACLSAGGRCMAHGGEATAPEAEGRSGSGTLDRAVRSESGPLSLAEEIMRKRTKPSDDVARMAQGGMVEDELEDEFHDGPDFSHLPNDEDDSTTGEAHDADDTDEAQDDTLVGQIMKRRAQKKG